MDVLGSVRRNEKLMIRGDLNGWVGNAGSGNEIELGQYGDKRINETGKLILKIYKERNFVVANIIFDQKHIHMYT